MIRSPNLLLCSLLLLLFISSSSLAQLPAFPGAEGFGSHTSGGRGGKVIRVTNLNDHGPGSLRAAIEAPGPRTIVFTVGGIINLEEKMVIREPWVTIAGQTSLGDGICLRGEGIMVRTHDVVIRHLRIRPGDIDFGPPNVWDHVDAISIWGTDSTYNVVIDHCSLSWSVDENIDVWGNAHDITIQHCIISEALNRSKHPTGAHGMGMLIGSKATNISVHHNLFAHNSDRNPLVNGKSRVDIRNNVIYNPGRAAVDLTGREGQQINLVNNYILQGPVTNIKADVQLRDTASRVPKLFIVGNVGIHHRSPQQDDWLMVRNIIGRIPDRAMQMTGPFEHPTVSTQSATVAYEQVLRNAGATLPRRDAVDRKVVRDINERQGAIIDQKRNFLGWPPFREETSPNDTDRDGMPDYWEHQYQLSGHSSNDHQDPDNDGYTNIEEYLNDTNPLSRINTPGVTPQGRLAGAAFKADTPLIPELAQNYPNPFSRQTQIKLTVDRAAWISISVFNTVGEQVANLVQELLYEGKYEFMWDATGLVPGVYTIHLHAPGFSRSIKAVVVRQ